MSTLVRSEALRGDFGLPDQGDRSEFHQRLELGESEGESNRRVIGVFFQARFEGGSVNGFPENEVEVGGIVEDGSAALKHAAFLGHLEKPALPGRVPRLSHRQHDFAWWSWRSPPLENW
jgi:hypothetical protein